MANASPVLFESCQAFLASDVPHALGKERLWAVVSSFGLHAAVAALAIALSINGGSGKTDASGDGAFAVAGYISLAGRGPAGSPPGAATAEAAQTDNPAPEAHAEAAATFQAQEPPLPSSPERKAKPNKTAKQESAAAAKAAPATGHKKSPEKARALAKEASAAGQGNGGESGGEKGSGAGGNANSQAGFGYALAEVDTKPQVVSRVQVRYPENARKRRLTGEVMLRFHLSEQGEISRLHILRAEPPGVFDESALAAVRQWKFSPATKDGKAVPVWINLPLPFFLK